MKDQEISMKKGSEKKTKLKIQKGYFSISELEEYSGISQRTLWDLLKDPINPIPHFRVGAAGRIVRVKKSEFDQWMLTQKSGDPQFIDQIVDEILK
jgi:excisionase family DNA binding protein